MYFERQPVGPQKSGLTGAVIILLTAFQETD